MINLNIKKYIALLRGINVGGNNQISMRALKELFEKAGFQDVSTYINSGNIIFIAEDMDNGILQSQCETMIFEEFGLHVSVIVMSAVEISEALRHAPVWWDTDKESKHNAMFVILPATVEDVYREVGEIKPEYEKVGHFNNVIFWSAPLKTFSRTRWSKVVGSAAYNSITIRNANTVKKLAELCDEK